MALPPLVNGVLPLGRYPASLPEIEERWVTSEDFSQSTTREAIWTEFMFGTRLLRLAVRVHAMWISGSFLTNRLDPADIDVVYLVNESERYSGTPDRGRVVDEFVLREWDESLEKYVPQHGLRRLDSYVVDWRPHITNVLEDDEYRAYARRRGYWDDWWQRKRTGEKTDPPVPEDAFPARGYLEVSLDAYA